MLPKIGMITDALWSDYDNDGDIDLILAGEYMPITILRQSNGKFETLQNTGLDNYTGWWNSLTAGDFDNDGDIDYVAGNTGFNTVTIVSEEYPIRAYFKDFDNNGNIDLIPSCYFADVNGEMQEYPYFSRLEIAKQYNIIKRKFKLHKEFAVTTMKELFTPEELNDCLILEANTFSHSYIENKGGGIFAIQPLPQLVQQAPIYGMTVEDFNNDGNLDVMMVGNDFGMELSTGRMDAHNGLILYGKGDGSFDAKGADQTGFYVPGDAKALASLYQESTKNIIYIASQNRGPLEVFSGPLGTDVIKLQQSDMSAVATLKNGQKRKMEFYFGSSFLSQSSRNIRIAADITSIEVTNTKGEKRSIQVQ
jgi:enediyne biosynthesis protein E4